MRGKVWHWLIPLPAVLSALLALATRDVLWRPAALPSRAGTMRGLPAHIVLVAVVVLSLFYLASFADGARYSMQSRHGRPASEAELGCALVLGRALMLIGLYGLALRVWFWTGP